MLRLGRVETKTRLWASVSNNLNIMNSIVKDSACKTDTTVELESSNCCDIKILKQAINTTRYLREERYLQSIKFLFKGKNCYTYICWVICFARLL